MRFYTLVCWLGFWTYQPLNAIYCQILLYIYIYIYSVSSTETDINTRLVKTYDQLSISYKSYRSQTWPIQWNAVFPGSGRIGTTVWMHYMDHNKKWGEKSWRQLHKNAASNIEHVLETALHKAAAVRPLTTHHENYPI